MSILSYLLNKLSIFYVEFFNYFYNFCAISKKGREFISFYCQFTIKLKFSMFVFNIFLTSSLIYKSKTHRNFEKLTKRIFTILRNIKHRKFINLFYYYFNQINIIHLHPAPLHDTFVVYNLNLSYFFQLKLPYLIVT